MPTESVVFEAPKKTISPRGRRRKGRDGRYKFRLLLEGRDWKTTTTTEGKPGEDLLATDPDGKVWAIEVKDVKIIDPKHRTQAMQQAKARRVRWMIANHISGTSTWLVQGQDRDPVVWHEERAND